jgi:hypothetical protein
LLTEIITRKKIQSLEEYKLNISKLTINFSADNSDYPYKSSHWKELGGAIYSECFEN